MKQRFVRRTSLAAILAIGAVLPGCGYLAVQSAPEKQPSTSRTAASLAADAHFWAVFHGGKYDESQPTLEQMTAVYLENPSDAITASHVAWLHIWKLSERERLDKVSATITDEIVMSRKYFQEAVALDPSEPRYLGFLGVVTSSEGAIHKDEKLIRKGYYLLRDSIDAWPEFNSSICSQPATA